MSRRAAEFITRRTVLTGIAAASGALLVRPGVLQSAGVPAVAVEPQPYFAGVGRVLNTVAQLGSPVAAEDSQRLAVLAGQNDVAAVDAAEALLDRYTLAHLAFYPNGSARVLPGGAQRVLVEQGWRVFLVRISNPAGRTPSVNFSTGWIWQGAGNMLPLISLAQRAPLMDTLNKAPMIDGAWLLSQLFESTSVAFSGVDIPVVRLTGIPIEYRVLQLFSRDSGRRPARLTLYTIANAGSGPVAAAHRAFDFDCLSSRNVTLGVQDVDGRGCVAAITIKDARGRVYPPQAMRLAPDLYFQEQVYRADGETVRVPDGEYTVESRRGPEYLPVRQAATIRAGAERIDVKLERWVDPARWGWYSGDIHIHAGGCAHYQVPTEGVSPETVIRQVRGEGLAVGDVLSWGPSWYYQKQFFTGHAVSPAATLEHPVLQAANRTSLRPQSTPEDAESVLRYDVEVSGFPSSHAGHLVLLRLKEQDYPGTKLIEDWPSWNLPILKWARAQGAVAGYAHCGSGMVVDSTELPNYDIPPMDGTGTQEAIVDVTHGMVDFLAGCDTPPPAELNAWYHLLNCGYRLAMAGESDFPCISGERPGIGRTYVRLDRRPIGESGYEAWIRGLKQGRLYCGDGRSHILDFRVNGHRSGDDDLRLEAGGKLQVEALVAARLEPDPPGRDLASRDEKGNGWHLENARIGSTRTVAVELVVAGIAIDRVQTSADGEPRPIRFEVPVTRSAWVALRILPSAHTHPVFVQLLDQPIRASKRSALWCRDCVDRIWEVKSPFMRASERAAAARAFDYARRTYDTIAAQCEVS
jgi:hypothetical protein